MRWRNLVRCVDAKESFFECAFLMLYFVLKNTGNTPVCLRVVKLYRRDEEERQWDLNKQNRKFKLHDFSNLEIRWPCVILPIRWNFLFLYIETKKFFIHSALYFCLSVPLLQESTRFLVLNFLINLKRRRQRKTL